MRVAIYCRVSREEQTSLNQEIRLKEYADRNGWAYDVFNEVETTRKTRPVKEKVLDMLRKREYDAVLIFRYDRWARSTIELITQMEELTNRGVGFISFSENVNLMTPEGKLMFTIIAGVAQFERSLIHIRTMEGLHRARLQGKIGGRPRKDGQPRTNHKYPSEITPSVN